MKNGKPDDERPNLDIDLGRLEVELQRQVKLCQNWNEKLADAQYDLDKAKQRSDVVEAEAELEIRNDSDKYGIEGKLTEATVKAQVYIHALVQDACMDVIKAKHRVGIIAAQTNAIEHRKRSLEGEISLYGQSYFAKPKVDKNVRDELDEADQRNIARRGRIPQRS